MQKLTILLITRRNSSQFPTNSILCYIHRRNANIHSTRSYKYIFQNVLSLLDMHAPILVQNITNGFYICQQLLLMEVSWHWHAILWRMHIFIFQIFMN